ncbi:MAG: hypothetical protein HKP09_03190 [Enterobacterales bacterium]|nr:hypothetical protein [Enterobacterales bacterium]
MNQRIIGQLMVATGFLCGAFLTSLDKNLVNWQYFIPAMVIGVLGVLIIRKADKNQATSEGVLSTNITNIEESIDRIVKNLIELNNKKADIPPYEMRFEIDKLFRDDLTLFADSRKSLGHRYGLQPYAEVMSAFAAGERYINRVWSASADGYVDEVMNYLSKAQSQFIEARDTLHGVMNKSATKAVAR